MIYFLCGVGVSYAYFAFNYENTSVIVGNVVSVDADLSVELVVGNNEGLVPMTDAALSNALNGVGSDNGACIDSLGNLSCQVYKITLTNNGSRLQHLVGTIELYPKEGSNNAYSNLKWQELTNVTTVKDGSVVNGMNKSILVSGLTLDSKETATWYVAVWLSEIDSDQKEIDKGEFGGIVTFEAIEGMVSGAIGAMNNIFAETVMKPNAKSDSSLDFSKTSEESETNGIYLRNGTENDSYPIYYYRGDVDNNLIFADFCWKVVRTTETGGLKLIYNGIPTDGECNNTGESTRIGTSMYNSNYNSISNVGYMYSTSYEISSKMMSNITEEYYYGNDVKYENGYYTLINTITSSDWNDLNNGNLNNYHYTCFSTNNVCTNIYYIYYTSSSYVYYITLKEGNKIENAFLEMLGTDEDNLSNYDLISSTIKGNNATEETIDYWYYTNIEERGYNSYVEDTIWCNDRNIYELGGWESNGGNTTSYLYFSGFERAISKYQPNLICSRNIDKFTVNSENGNGALSYPIGLLTVDEFMLAGAVYNVSNNSYYLYSGVSFWSNSAYYFEYHGYANLFFINSSGILTNSNVNSARSIRPSISLKNGFNLIGDGDGTVDNPYVVE